MKVVKYVNHGKRVPDVLRFRGVGLLFHVGIDGCEVVSISTPLNRKERD